jgi:hypothetical protein
VLSARREDRIRLGLSVAYHLKNLAAAMGAPHDEASTPRSPAKGAAVSKSRPTDRDAAAAELLRGHLEYWGSSTLPELADVKGMAGVGRGRRTKRPKQSAVG